MIRENLKIMMLKPFAMRMWYGNLRENSRITIVKVLEKIGEVWCTVFPFLNLKRSNQTTRNFF